ncbi:MAG: hypothetical protein JKY67_01785 [Pseudomonadales bacterium]|nr:hypothetical protein [Pseudomonadales bacterium]
MPPTKKPSMGAYSGPVLGLKQTDISTNRKRAIFTAMYIVAGLGVADLVRLSSSET